MDEPITAYDQLRTIRTMVQTIPEPENAGETPQQYIARLNSALNVIVDMVNDYERRIGQREAS